MPNTTTAIRCALPGALALGLSFGACAQQFPDRPVRIITTQPGNTSDLGARMIGPILSKSINQTVIVDNRGSSVIAAEVVSQAAGDGSTLLALGSTFWIAPVLGKVPYDPIKDFAAITSTTTSPNVLVVHPTLAARTVGELIALAKSKPGALNYSSGAAGGSGHIAAELFKSMAGVDMVYVPYKGGGPALAALLTGEVQLMFNSASAVMPHVRSGKLRALGVTSTKPSPLAPGLTPVADMGLPGYESGSVQGLWTSSKAPAATVTRLNREIVAVLNQPAVREQITKTGAEPAPTTSADFVAYIRSDMEKVGKYIKITGIEFN